MTRKGRSRYAAGDLRGAAGEVKRARRKTFVNANVMPAGNPGQVLIGPQEQLIASAALGGMFGAQQQAPESGDAIPWAGLREFRAALCGGGSPYSGLGGLSPFTSPTGYGAQTNLTSFMPMWANLQFAPLTLQWVTLMYAYTTYGIIQRAIDVPVLDAFRGGLDLNSDEMDSAQLELMSKCLYSFGILKSFVNARIWARLFGGAGLIFNQDGQDFSEPLDFKTLDGPIELYDCSRWELGSDRRIPKSGYYDFLGHRVHMSRVMTLTGKRAPWLIREQLADWGLSEIQRMSEDFNGYIRTKNAIYELMVEAKVDVFKLARLNSQVNSPLATQLTNARIAQVNRSKSFNSAIVMDAEDDYQQKQIQFSGLGEMKKENRMDMAENIGQPMSKIWGIASTGFSSGEDDLESYNANVESQEREPARPQILNLLRVLSFTLFHQDLHIDFNWKPLRVMTSKDEEDIAASKTARIVSMLQSQIINREEAIEMVRKEKLVNIPITDKVGAGELAPDQALKIDLEELEEGEATGRESPGRGGEQPALVGAEAVGDPTGIVEGPFSGFQRETLPPGDSGWRPKS